MHPYLSFKGDCEAAFKYYERHLGGQLRGVFRYGNSPMENEAPSGWGDKIMHSSLTIEGQVLFGGDVPPERYEAPKGITLSLQTTTVEESDRIFQALAEGGEVLTPLEQTFWALRFGMVVDRFGIPWMINCEAPS